MAIVSKIPEIVRERGLSLTDLSKLTNMTLRSITKLYYADITSIRIETLDRLCNVLETTPGDLFTHIPTPGVETTCPALTEKPTSPTRTRIHSRNKRALKAKIINTQED